MTKKDQTTQTKSLTKSSCERASRGTTNNCTLCENVNKDIFDRCKNQYK